MSKTACITGITGQTGSHLCELLLEEGYKVYGLKRHISSFNTDRINHIFDNPNLKLVYGDLSDANSINSFVGDIKPDLFFNLGAMSFVKASFTIPEYTIDINTNGVLRCLEAIKNISPKTKFLQASSSEQFGLTLPGPNGQDESSPMIPASPYGVSKLGAFHLVKHYREAYKNLFTCNSISFNHEGPRRAPVFITKKVIARAVEISLGLANELRVGDTNPRRSWTHAKDICKGMYKIINHDVPDDFVLGIEESHSVQELIEMVFGKLNLDWKKYVIIDEKYMRPVDVMDLRPNCSKAKNKLGWAPEITFNQMVDEMIEFELKLRK